MKVVDIADEIFRELSEPSTLSIPAIAYWVRTVSYTHLTLPTKA